MLLWNLFAAFRLGNAEAADEARAMSDWSDEETDDPVYADRHNFYKVEKWSRDGLRVELLLYAGTNLDKAHRIFERTVKHRPRVRLTIRQRMQGACLFTKRLERGRFLWPGATDGAVTISSAQLGYLLSGIDWRNPQETWRPTSVG